MWLPPCPLSFVCAECERRRLESLGEKFSCLTQFGERAAALSCLFSLCVDCGTHPALPVVRPDGERGCISTSHLSQPSQEVLPFDLALSLAASAVGLYDSQTGTFPV